MMRISGNSVRRFLAPRLRDESGAALLIALFLITTVAALSVAIGGVVLSQRVPTQFARKNVQTINAAEGGIEAGLSRIRAASSGSTGVVTSLPCTSTYGASFTGSLGPDQGNLNYTTTITYYWADPSFPSNRTTANQVKCSSSGSPTVPNYALISSAATGTGVGGLAASDGDRSLEAVYNFSLTNANISGGAIPLFQTTFCIDASASPAVGTYVTMQPCVSGLPQQSWSYNKDLTISLTGMAQNTLCLQANPNNSTSTKIRLATCSTSNMQQWSFNAAGEYEGTDTSQNYNGYCFYAAATAGTQIGLTTTCNSGHDSVHTWAPDAKVGAGAAGYPNTTNQLVNYKEFGRCLDDTGWDVNYAFLIDYPCKQTPNPANVDQNQVFTGPNSSGQMVMAYNPSGTGPFCLQAGTSTTPAVSGTLVLTKKCVSTDNSQKWTSTGSTGNNATNYNYVTKNGLCLSIAPATASAIAAGLPWSQIIVETCDGSLKQKWNAPPLTAGAGLNNTWETTT